MRGDSEVGIENTGEFLFSKVQKPAGMVSREEHQLLLSPFPRSRWRKLAQALVGGLTSMVPFKAVGQRSFNYYLGLWRSVSRLVFPKTAFQLRTTSGFRVKWTLLSI